MDLRDAQVETFHLFWNVWPLRQAIFLGFFNTNRLPQRFSPDLALDEATISILAVWRVCFSLVVYWITGFHITNAFNHHSESQKFRLA